MSPPVSAPAGTFLYARAFSRQACQAVGTPLRFAHVPAG
nr:MAG TPA: hypothetical protein [Caudoviricetes sp.]